MYTEYLLEINKPHRNMFHCLWSASNTMKQLMHQYISFFFVYVHCISSSSLLHSIIPPLPLPLLHLYSSYLFLKHSQFPETMASALVVSSLLLLPVLRLIKFVLTSFNFVLRLANVLSTISTMLTKPPTSSGSNSVRESSWILTVPKYSFVNN